MAPRSYSQHGSGYQDSGRASRRGSLLELLTFDRLIAGRLIHLIYWAGLAVIEKVLGAPKSSLHFECPPRDSH